MLVLMALTVLYGNDELALDKAFMALRIGHTAFAEFEPPFSFTSVEWALTSESLFENSKLAVIRSFFKGARGGVLPQSTQQLVPLMQRTRSDIICIEPDEYKVASYKKLFPKATFQGFSIPKHLFYFLDGLYPSNLAKTYDEYVEALKTTAPDLLFYFLKKRIRELLLLSENSLTGSYQPWQKAKLKSQLMRWKVNRLTSAYKSLYRLERDMKSGNTPYDTDKSISLFLCFYL